MVANYHLSEEIGSHIEYFFVIENIELFFFIFDKVDGATPSDRVQTKALLPFELIIKIKYEERFDF